MAYNAVASDTGTKLQVTITDEDSGDAVDLTGAAVALKWPALDGSTTYSKSMTIETPATAGVVSYTFTTGELVAGLMRLEVRITDASSLTTTTLDPIELNVRARLVS